MLEVTRAKRIQGEFRPPPDKSLTHRAYLLAAAAGSPSAIINPLRGEDCEATLRCLEQLGVSAVRQDDGSTRIQPIGDWRSPTSDLDCGNSGTTMRLLAGMIAARPVSARLVGDASLSTRPMARVVEPLVRMGAQISCESQGDRPPVLVTGAALQGIEHNSPVASAQVKSCVLLAGCRAEGRTAVVEPTLSRDHTEILLRALGVEVEQFETPHGPGASLSGEQSWDGFRFNVPGDISSAAFLLVAAAALPGSRLVGHGVGLNPTRAGLLEVFVQCGVAMRTHPAAPELGEIVGDISISAVESLKPFSIGGELVSRLIDEIPVLAVLATQCEGVSVVRDARELRVKESDRIEKVAAGLRLMGAEVETAEDGFSIEGPTRLRGAQIDAAGDHRIAMAFAIAGLLADGATRIDGEESIATSYPGFQNHLRRLVYR